MLSAAEREAFARDVAAIESYSDLLLWAKTNPGDFQARTIVSDVIVQDEYTHDAIVPWRCGLVLVFDST